MLCRRRDTSRIHSIAALPPPPLPTEPEMLFANPVSLAAITQQSRDKSAMPSFDFSSCCARIGRGGRLIMSRCQPFTYEPLDIQPAEEQQKMPFDLAVPYLAAAQAARQVQIKFSYDRPALWIQEMVSSTPSWTCSIGASRSRYITLWHVFGSGVLHSYSKDKVHMMHECPALQLGALSIFLCIWH